jgi:hypothetical protein
MDYGKAIDKFAVWRLGKRKHIVEEGGGHREDRFVDTERDTN